MNTTVELIHRPFGDRHPYESAADERVPRHPYPDEIVEIRVLTRPIGEIQKAYIEYWDARNPEQVERKALAFSESVSMEGAVTDDGHLSEAAARAGLIVGVDHWHVSLPDSPAGIKVHYQLFAETKDERLTSQIYTYTVREVIPLHKVAGVYQGANSCTVAVYNPEADRDGYIHLHVVEDGHVQIKVGQGKYYPFAPAEREISEDDLITLNEVTVRCRAEPFNLQLFYRSRLILSGVRAPQLIIGDADRVEAVQLALDSPEDECFYGFGERFNALDQRGQRLDVRVYEQYKNHGLRTYMPMPLFISSEGYGLLVRSLRYSVFDLAHHEPDCWRLKTELGDESSVTLDMLLGESTQLLDLVARMSALTGLPKLPPNWAFGLWMSSNEWNNQARVEEVVKQHQKNGIPASVIVLEAWSDENTFYIWNEAEYEPKDGEAFFGYEDFTFPPDGLWPDPKGMIEKLHQQGYRVLLWQIPVLKVNEENHPQLANDRAYMLEKGICVHHRDGSPYHIRPFWFRDGLLMDFTHPEGVNWWMQKRAYLLTELGVDGFKTDGGEHMWGRDLVFADGRGSDEVWNAYPNLYAKAYFQFARKHKPDGITFSRAGYTGAQAFPCHWAGDENSTWEAFRHSILAGLNAGISGVSFWGWDFAGFSGEIPTAELYLRATGMAAFCPIMQYHSEYNHHRQPSNDRTPWNIQDRTGDRDVLPIFRFFANLRMNLLPYILSEAWQSSQTGIPLMRALALEFPTDIICRQFPYQYLFGSSLLIAPVVEEGVSQWPVYLPAGDWYDLWTGECHKGGQVLEYRVPKDYIPVFVRSGTILPLNLADSFELGSDVGNRLNQYKNLCFKIYPQQEKPYIWHDFVEQQTYELTYAQVEGKGSLLTSTPLLDHTILFAENKPDDNI